ncbi:MAG TPA: carbohydrate kinase family protein [Candidatus Eremiobacteraeota bacterium]|nr:MAG: putative sugar kinase YdjH [bacterium ADurb.Bin363]HPZ08242.1 carbohydrate kinase family protein [Candidatus Eremiobacteraeota bacterium]
MKKILISGLINIETTLKIDSFPVEYFPVRYPFFGVNSTVSGVGYNVAKALTTLGDTVNFLSIIGSDLAGRMVKETLQKNNIKENYVIQSIDHTAQSVILFDRTGKRQINVDLKNIQEQIYPEELFLEASRECSMAVLCNINFSRPFLKKIKEMNKLIATDVHAISNIYDEYNQDFMRYGDILFMSDELLPCHPVEWIKHLLNLYGNEIIVVGLGSEGSLLSVKRDNFIDKIPAVYTRNVVNTTGAGDALFSSFVHFYNKTKNPYEALEKASVFASYKIGEHGAADGFLDEKTLEKLSINYKKLN